MEKKKLEDLTEEEARTLIEKAIRSGKHARGTTKPKDHEKNRKAKRKNAKAARRLNRPKD